METRPSNTSGTIPVPPLVSGSDDDRISNSGNVGEVTNAKYTLPKNANRVQPCQPDFVRDLILLAEFDEISGPRPLMTIPRKAHSWMDLDSFVLRIMTVDFQANTSGGGGSSNNHGSGNRNASGAHHTTKFRVIEDSQVMLSEPVVGVSAYIRHFTLYDVQARGFVRPMCLCYVTSDTNKVLKYFTQISNDFAKVCRLLKYGNQYKFLSDLDYQQSHVRHTLDLLTSVSSAIASTLASANGAGNEEGEGKTSR